MTVSGTQAAGQSATTRRRKPITLHSWRPWRYEFWRTVFALPYRLLDTPPVLDAAAVFPASSELIDDFDAIRAELLALSLGDDVPTFDAILPNQKEFYDWDQRHWRMAVLRSYYLDVPENLARAPRMKAFLARHPEVSTAIVSVLEPRKHIAPHDGPFRGILRYHLGLLVEAYPDGSTAGKLVVDGQEHYIREGEGMLWDDTYMHEAFNLSDKPRVALLLDVYRPGMPWALRRYTDLVIWTVRAMAKRRGADKRMVVPQRPKRAA